MKKLLLLSTVLLGAIPASQAGVHFGFGLNLPLPVPPPFILGRAPAVVVQPALPPVCEPTAPVVVAPGCYPPYYYAPQYYPYRHGYFAHRGWERPHGFRR